MSLTDLWITTFKPSPNAPLRLFCLPYAGAGALAYRAWADEMSPEIELCAIQLPGRETRFKESPLTELGPLVSTLSAILYPYRLDRPFAFFGHSLGALIGFELARALAKHYNVVPAHLFMSARIAPHYIDPRPPFHSLPDAEFKAKLRELNGTPEEVLNNPELAPILAMLRADFAMNENYRYPGGEPLDAPITAFGGTDDPKVSKEELSGWKLHTRKQFQLRFFPGDHFFIQSARAAVVRAIAQRLTAVL